MKHPKPVRVQLAYSPIDSAYGSCAVPFQPNAPSRAVAPTAGRATPYVTDPLQCWQNLGSGEVTCLNNESHGGLSGIRNVPSIPFDSPLNRILTREPVGPWELVGFITTDDPTLAQSRDRTMTMYAQTVDRRRDRYNYRVVDSNAVPLDIGDKVRWKSDGESVAIPGQSATYTMHLYGQFK
jgi:hypothetical protein